MAKNTIETKITEHVQGKVDEMVNTAKTETVWYKKLGYYVAAAIGAAVIYAVQNYGDQIVNLITSLF